MIPTFLIIVMARYTMDVKEIPYEKPPEEKKGKVWEKSIERSRGSLTAPTLRTFRNDVSDLVKDTGLTKIQVVLAEQSRRHTRESSRETHDEEPHLLRVIFGLLLLLAFGIGVGAYVLIGAKIMPPFLSNETMGGISSPAKKNTSIIIGDSPREQVMADISIIFDQTALSLGEKRMITFLANNDENTATVASTSRVLSVLSLKPPPHTLLLSLSEDSDFGIVASPTLTGFFILQSRSYPNTLAGMLLWESSMARDLIPPLLPHYARKDIKLLDGRAFRDERVEGTNARILRDPEGNSLLAYTFSGEKTLIITGSVDALRLLIKTSGVQSAK